MAELERPISRVDAGDVQNRTLAATPRFDGALAPADSATPPAKVAPPDGVVPLQLASEPTGAIQPTQATRTSARASVQVDFLAEASAAFAVPSAIDATPSARGRDMPDTAVAALSSWEQTFVWVVKPGDSLRAVAEDFNTTVAALEVLNALASDAILHVDQRVLVPVGFRALLERPSPAAQPNDAAQRRSDRARGAQ